MRRWCALSLSAALVVGAGVGPDAAAVAVTPLAGSYVSVRPSRVLDTRSGLGAPATAVHAHQAITVQVAGRGAVPASGVSAVVLNVTVVGSSAGGYVTVYPGTGTRPATSSLNFSAGRTVANLAVVRLGSNGRVALYNGSSASVQLIADVSGYHLGGDVGPGSYVPVRPTRWMDTRKYLRSGPLTPERATELCVTDVGGVPMSGVSAVVLNVAAIDPTWAGYLTVYPAGAHRPGTSNLDFARGRTVAGLVMAPVGRNGCVELFNGSPDQLDAVVDIAGFYVAGAGPAGSLRTLTPARVLDTRTGTGAPRRTALAHSSITVQLAGRGGMPATDMAAAALTLTATGSTRGGYLTLYPAGTSRPVASTVNFAAGQTIANAAEVQVGTAGRVTVYNGSSAPVQIIADASAYYVATSPITWSAPQPIDTAHHLTAVSCASTTYCVAVDDVGNAFTYNGSSWSAPVAASAGRLLSDVSCATSEFCVATADHGAVTIWDGAAWSTQQVVAAPDTHSLAGISCPTTTFCGAITTVGAAAYTWDGAHWSGPVSAGPADLSEPSISCSSAQQCEAVDAAGEAVRFNGAAWSAQGHVDNGSVGPTAVSCPSATSCVAVDIRGGAVVDRTSTWGQPETIDPPMPTYDSAISLDSVSCASSSYCVAVDGYRSAFVYDGSGWTAGPRFAPGESPVAVSCPQVSMCVAVDGEGRALVGH